MSFGNKSIVGLSDEKTSESSALPGSQDQAKQEKGRFSLSGKGRETKGGILVERPGHSPGSWEQWHLSTGNEPELLAGGTPPPPGCERIVILPSSTLFSWPLWIAAAGEVLDLVRLELSGRHLLKRGMDETLTAVPIVRREERQLLLAVATDEPFPVEVMPPEWKRVSRFELPARLLPGSLKFDLILWREWGVLQMAFYRDSKPVWFCSARLQELSGLMQRMALRLLAEGVLEHLPLTILMVGMQNEVADQCAAALNRAFPRAQISRNPLSSGSTTPAPVLRDDVFDLPPAEAREERRALRKRQKLLSFATAGAVFYLLLLVWAAGYFFIKQTALKRLQQEVSHLQAPSLNAQDESDRWHTFRSAIDPATYALDLLAAVASPTEGGKIRLTLYSLEQGTLHISGEATDITQAYNFIEQLKKNPRLQEYNWNAGVPQIAGKSGVRFDIEGTRIDAPHETTGS